ncbi:MAG TPA: 3-deoxy-7-phosphoheptulonate synthase [Myxococcota bacterium]|jgi:3-deoxy-7-phosphoheptulonate synthase
MDALENTNLSALEELPPPRALKRELAASRAAVQTVLTGRAAVRDALHGRDSRLVAIVGPCSLHDPDAALEYARRLREVAESVRGDLIVLMRAYFEKPRTTIGWKGLVNDPNLDGSCDAPRGLALARELLLEISALGLPCATEFLDPITPQYLADLVAWAAIGARTAESQTHREMASGLSMPVGIKNGTDGSVQVAVDAVTTARHPHVFLGINALGRAAVVRTTGNPDAHVVLRGGRSGPNWSAAAIADAAQRIAPPGLARGVIVDCSHENSNKLPAQQVEVARALAALGPAGAPALLGVMLESFLRAGRQDWKPGGTHERGLSITDACIGFAETEELLGELARAWRR